MSFANKQHSAGPGLSRGLRFQQPFRSPLRTPDAGKLELEASPSIAKSPASFSGNQCVLKDASSLKNFGNIEEAKTSRKGVCDEAAPGGSGSSNTTPKRPPNSSYSGGLSARYRKIGPRQFSSPFRSPASSSPQQTVSKAEELHQLLKREEELDKEISSLRNLGMQEQELQGHIENLHKYNEIKDSAQLVMGKLAELEGVTVKEMHERYEVTVLD